MQREKEEKAKEEAMKEEEKKAAKLVDADGSRITFETKATPVLKVGFVC